MRWLKTIALSSLVLPVQGEHLAVVPGWINYGRDAEGSPSQYRPLKLGGAFDRFGRVTAIDFVGDHAPTDRIAGEMAEFLARIASKGPATILGLSYGAMMTILARKLVDSQNIHTVLIDPPAGGDSLIKLNQLHVAALAEKIGELPEWLNGGLPQWLFDKLFCPGFSSSDPIAVPKGLSEEGVVRYIAGVRKDAYDGQQGFPLTRCFEQIGAMARADGLPEACAKITQRGDRVTRILCTKDNQVVDPAVANPFFREHLTNAFVREFPANHADFLQQRDLWSSFLKNLL